MISPEALTNNARRGEEIMKHRFCAVLGTALLAGILTTASVRAEEAKLEDVTMAVPTFSLAYTLEFLNQDLGFYAKHGVRVKTVQIEGLGTINAVISGSVDFGQPSGASLTRAAARGQRLLAIVEILGHPSAQVVLRKELAEAAGFDPKAPLEKRAQVLKGRTMGVDGVNSVLHAMMMIALKRAGVSQDDVRLGIMVAPSMNPAFELKQIDGFVGALPWTLQPVLNGSAVLVVSGPDGDPGDMKNLANTIVLTRPDTCEKRKSVCMAIGHAFAEASVYLHAHPAEAAAIVKKRFPTLDDKLYAAAFEITRKITPNPPVPTKESIENTDLYNVAAGLMKPEEKLPSYDGLYTDEYVK
jgi:ABC-type nitrate/sulfonate/bicarbonate transport system substrate-binding protein